MSEVRKNERKPISDQPVGLTFQLFEKGCEYLEKIISHTRAIPLVDQPKIFDINHQQCDSFLMEGCVYKLVIEGLVVGNASQPVESQLFPLPHQIAEQQDEAVAQCQQVWLAKELEEEQGEEEKGDDQ